jgi:hypothetical protein
MEMKIFQEWHDRCKIIGARLRLGNQNLGEKNEYPVSGTVCEDAESADP